MNPRRTATRIAVVVMSAAAFAAVGGRVAQAATTTAIVSETFTGQTTASSKWARIGSTIPCLTAGTNTSQTPIKACSTTAIDPAGSGVLQLTAQAAGSMGTVFSSTSLPTSQGLDIRFNSYQWNTTTGNGGDGLSFALVATDPANPAVPANAGGGGGRLGYAPTTSVNGVPYGYLGFGLDTFGNFSSTVSNGTDCIGGARTPQSIAVRGPGNGKSGYCMLASSTVDPGTLDAPTATTRPSAVPAEVVVNPGSATTTASGISVPANSWLLRVTPLGGAAKSISGSLPTGSTLTGYGFPSAWLDPATGLPYRVMLGWSGAMGTSTEFHEIDSASATSLNGQLPAYTLAVTDNESGKLLAGNQAVVTATPALDGSQGPESGPVTVKATFPAGLTPGSVTTSDYSCTTSGQVVTCILTPSSPIAAGTTLSAIAVPVTVLSGASGSKTVTATVSSTDADPVTASDTVSVATLAASAAPSSITHGATTTLKTTGLPSVATGSVAFSSGATALCTATLPTTTCTTSGTLGAGSYPVTATYSGDSHYAQQSTSTSFSVTRAGTTITASASPASVAHGSASTLNVTGLPGDATGTVTYTSGATTLCTATLPTTSCTTSGTLGTGSYPVTATYGGDGNYTGSSGSTSVTVTKAATTVTAHASPASPAYGSASTLSVTGLPGDATGTVTFTSGAATLCTATLPTTSCATSATLAPATYPVTATYGGDGNYTGSSGSTSVTVTKAATTVTAHASPASPAYGSASTLSVTGLPGDATGTVTFTSGAATLCTATLPTTSCATSATLTPATYPVTATYGGDSHYLTASDSTSLTVTKAATAPSAGVGSTHIAHGTAETLVISGLPGDATGSVQFTSGGTTLCTTNLPTTSCTAPPDLDAGTYPVTATYSGDSHYLTGTATTTFDVDPQSTSAFAASATPATTSYGSAETMAFTGVPAGSGGTVSFMSGGTTLCTATLPATSCSAPATLGPAIYPVAAAYSGDHNHLGASDSTSFTVTRAAPTVTAHASPASVPYGNASTLSVTGLPGDTTGTVTFTSGGTTLCTATLPATSCATPANLDAASYSVTATYSGDSNYFSANNSTTLTVTPTAPTLTAHVSPASVTYGDASTLSVTGLPGDTTGTVSFTSGGTTLCAATLPTRSCSTTADLDAGTYSVTATYSGDSNYLTASDTTSFTVTKAATTVTAHASPTSVAHGDASTLSVTGLPGDTTGTVTFASGGATLCTATLPGKSCSAPANLDAGTYPVTATYDGDHNYLTATDTTSFTVTRAASTVTAHASPASVAYGDASTLSVTGLPGDATGTIAFTSGAMTLCTATLPATSCATPATLGPGSYSVSADYSGDGNYFTATDTTSFTVTRAATAVTAHASPASVAYGQASSLSVTGLPGGAAGTVTFTSAGATLCSATLPATSCTGPADLDAGTYPVTATYGGDSNYLAASDGTSFTVTKAATTVTASVSDAIVEHGNADTLALTGIPAGSSGTVTFTSGGSTLCTATLPTTSCTAPSDLAVATYPVTAGYSGDHNHLAASDTTSFTVTKASTTVTAHASPASVGYGDASTLSVTGLPGDASGTVSYTSGGTTLCAATLPATSCSAPSDLDVGTYPVTATYGGDGNYFAANDTTSFTVTKAATTMTAHASPASVGYGDASMLSVTGLPGDTTGTVTFTSGATTLCAAILPATSCSTPADLDAADYPVAADYSGDSKHLAASGTTSFTVTKPSTTVTAHASPASMGYGGASTLSVTGLPGDATGTVTFTSGGSTLCTVALPAISCASPTTLDPATHSVTATYSGDGHYLAASDTTSFTVTKASTAPVAGVGSAHVAHGTAQTLVISALPNDATGTTTFTTGTTTLCTATLPTRSCSAPADLDAGSYLVTATYSGDSHYLTGVANTAFDVDPGDTTGFTASATPSATSYGSAETLAYLGLPGDATGTVTFTSGTTTLCIATLPATSCTAPSNLAVASYPVSADYSGDGNHLAATATTSFTVIGATATLTAHAGPASVTYGSSSTLSVTGLPGDATGTVTYTSDAITLCTATLPTTSCATPTTLDRATYSVTATYNGDGHYLAASDNTSFTVIKAPTALAASVGSPRVAHGTAQTLVGSGLPTTAGGTVRFTSGDTTLCTATLPARSCSTEAGLDVGTYRVAATYSGDHNHRPSTATTSFTVTRVAATLVASVSDPTAAYGKIETLAASGLAGDATGAIRFASDAAILCTATLPATSCTAPAGLDADDYPVTATYSGDRDHLAATAHAAFRVLPIVTTNRSVITSAGATITIPIPGATGAKSVIITGPPSHGTARIVDGKVVYAAPDSLFGTDAVTVRVTAADGSIADFHATIGIRDDAVRTDPGQHHHLPMTGVDALSGLVLGGAMLLLGSLTLWLSRRRTATPVRRRGAHRAR